MGRINKHSNLYNKDGELLRKAPLEDCPIEELENMVDNEKNPKLQSEMIGILMQMYQKYGNPHEDDIIRKIQEQANHKITTEDIEKALGEVNVQLSENQEDTPVYDVDSPDTEDATIIEEAA